MPRLVLRLVLFLSDLLVLLALVLPGLRERQNISYRRDGDISIGFLVSIHEISNVSLGKCDTFRASEVIIAEAFFYAVDQINSRTDILPNISLGFIALDDCLSESKALEASIYMTSPSTSIDPSNRSRSECMRDATATDPTEDRVVGVIGLSNSRMAVAVAPYFGVFQIPTLSLSASSDELSDKSRYEYFSRLIPPDRFQEETLLQIADQMGWTYLSLVYSDGSYGENAALQINRLLRSTFRNICLAASVKIASDAEAKEFDSAARHLVSGVVAARVVLVFIQENHLNGFFAAARRLMRPGEKVLFLGSDGISELQSQPFADVLEGAIYTDTESVLIPGIQQYVGSLSPWLAPRDVWLSILWQELFGCRLDSLSTFSKYKVKCNPNQTIGEVSDSVVWSLPNAARSFDAAYVFAYALNSLIQHECPEASGDKSKLKDCISGQNLLQHIRNISFQGTVDWIRFDHEGNFIGDLIIRQYQKRQNDTQRTPVTPVPVGIRNSSAGEVTLDLEKMDWTIFHAIPVNDTTGVIESVCSKPCPANEFPIAQDKTCCWICVKCRSNEIVNKNRTACEACPEFSWPDEDIPMTCVPIKPNSLQMSHSLSLSLLCLASIGCSISLSVSIVYLVKRKHRRIKATCIELSLIILTGTVLANVTVILFIAEPREGLCVARSIGFHSAINMLYGPLLVKNIRMYRIFRAGGTTVIKPRFVGRWAQFAFAAILAAIQGILLTISELLDLSSVALNMPTPYEKYVEIYCQKSVLLFLLPLSYNITLMAVCTLLGCITRKLPENFNESAYIFVSVSTTLFAWTVFIPAYFTQTNLYLQPAILGFCLVLNAFVTLASLFFRVIYAVFFSAQKTIQVN